MRPIDCPGHVFERWAFDDYAVCKRCRLGISGESIAAVRRKKPDGTKEPLAEAARRAAVMQLESGEEPYIIPERP